MRYKFFVKSYLLFNIMFVFSKPITIFAIDTNNIVAGAAKMQPTAIIDISQTNCIQDKQELKINTTIKEDTSTQIFSDDVLKQEQKKQQLYDIINPLIGQVPYRWGEKSTRNDWCFETGLDCSGFVEYVYNQLNIPYEGKLTSTIQISDSTIEISKEELQYGDLGLLWRGGSYYIKENFLMNENIGEQILIDSTSLEQETDINFTGDFDGDGIKDDTAILKANHVGIYMGKDENGNDKWAHCNTKDGTVVINTVDYFTYFCRVKL